MVVRRRGDAASPSEDQEIHGDGGAMASDGSDPFSATGCSARGR